MVGREEEASEPGDRHHGQASAGKGRATTPALTETQQRGRHPLIGVAQGSTPPATISKRRGETRSHPCLRTGGLIISSRQAMETTRQAQALGSHTGKS